MTIDISNSGHLPPALTSTVSGHGNSAPRNDTGAVASETGNAKSGDTVSLTGTAQQLRQLEHSLAQQPVVDTQRVEATKRAIDNGSYQIDPSRIASKMIGLERALGGAH